MNAVWHYATEHEFAIVCGFLILSAVVVTAWGLVVNHLKRTPAPTTAADLAVAYEPWEAESDTPIFDRCAAKQADRLRAELEDDAAVARWINGGAA